MKRSMVTLVAVRLTTLKLRGAVLKLVTWLHAVEAKIKSLNGSQFRLIIHSYILFTFSEVMASLAQWAGISTLRTLRDHSRCCKLRW